MYKLSAIKLVGTRMVDYQSTPAHRPTFCWGCKTDTHMVDAKLQPLFQDGQEESNSNDDREAAEQVIVSYELVQQLEIDYTRPVIVLGPLKDRINDELISG